LHQGLFGPLVYVGFLQKSFLKKVWMVLEKRKSFMQKSGTKRSLFRLRLRLLHVVLDVILIVCLVIFAVAWLVSNDWDCLMSLWKNHALFLLYGSIYLIFSIDALFGLTWHMLTPYWLQNKSPIASMIIWFLTCDTTLCFFQWCFVAMRDYGLYCSLSWSLPVFC
jgi:hypothetical protein